MAVDTSRIDDLKKQGLEIQTKKAESARQHSENVREHTFESEKIASLDAEKASQSSCSWGTIAL